MAVGIFLVDISREIYERGHFAHPTDLLRAAVGMEQISLDSIFTGWTIHTKACAGLPSSGGKFKVAATRRRGRSRATKPYHACYRREKGKEKGWQALIPMSVTFPSLLSHPFRGGRPSTEKDAQWSLDHLAALFTWLLLSITCVQSLTCPTFFLGELWIMAIKSYWNICIIRAQLQAAMPSAGFLKAPNGTPKTNATNSMFLSVWSLAE